MDTPKIIERLRKGRTELSQKELAKNLGMSLSTYQRMIDGTSPVTLDAVHKAAKYFNVHEDVILGRTPIFNEGKVEEPRVQFGINLGTMVMVTLDGSQSTLNEWINKLHAINKVL